ncbi:hypothetical protein [Salegentibacter sp. Hel_I_6]|uniref:hypothetical protein n=1 Tax=Salegentibacter sp. Hel_I_6 TaxID=1250278 RepID=UPI0005605E01|nr:hypothetical protein [Salegentibacter sp. Hel_I_6]
MSKKHKISNDLLVIIFRAAYVVLWVAFVIVIYLKDYFIAFLLLFPILGWTLKGKIFRLKSVSFDDKYIYINNEIFPLEKIIKIKFGVLSGTYVQINNKKYYFMAIEEEWGITNKKKLLERHQNN